MIRGLGLGQFRQPLANGVFRQEFLGQPDVGAVVAGFGFEQAAVERGQLAVGQPVAQEAKPLARAGLDQAGDQQPIDGPLRLVLADQLVQLRRRSWLGGSL